MKTIADFYRSDDPGVSLLDIGGFSPLCARPNAMLLPFLSYLVILGYCHRRLTQRQAIEGFVDVADLTV